jgi:hypothetical protein
MTASQIQGLLCPDGQVCLTLIATESYLPPTYLSHTFVVHVGDRILLNALVTNNSPNTIYYVDDCVRSAISAIFDNHVVVHPKIGCFAMGPPGRILSHQSKWVGGPDTHTEYEAAQAGYVTSKVTFTYNAGKVSKGFAFVIFPAPHVL